MSTIVHVREGGGIRNVHVDKMFGKILTPTRRHEFIFGDMNMGCDLLLHLGLSLGTYLKVILNQICGANVQIRKHIMIVVSIKK